MAKKNYYVVKKGHKKGIFTSWPECQASVNGFKGAIYKGFETKAEALEWLNDEESPTEPKDSDTMMTKAIYNVDFEVYTDGSFANGRYSYGYAFVKAGEVIFEGSGIGEDLEASCMRNVAGEIAAVRHAVEKAISLNVRIRIIHDYSGISHWVTGDWQAKNKFTKAYVEFMRAHRGLYEFQKVAGHSGDRFNDYVDGLAKQALGIRT